MAPSSTQTRGEDVAGKRTFAADIQTIGAMDVARHRTHNDNLLGVDIGDDGGVAANGDAAVAKVDGALDTAVDVERFGAADVALDDYGASDGGLLHRGV